MGKILEELSMICGQMAEPPLDEDIKNLEQEIAAIEEEIKKFLPEYNKFLLDELFSAIYERDVIEMQKNVETAFGYHLSKRDRCKLAFKNKKHIPSACMKKIR